MPVGLSHLFTGTGKEITPAEKWIPYKKKTNSFNKSIETEIIGSFKSDKVSKSLHPNKKKTAKKERSKTKEIG